MALMNLTDMDLDRAYEYHERHHIGLNDDGLRASNCDACLNAEDRAETLAVEDDLIFTAWRVVSE